MAFEISQNVVPDKRSVQPGKLGQNDPKVVYMGPEKGPFQCGHCEYYVDPRQCKKVTGDIDPGGCCNLYQSVAAPGSSAGNPPKGASSNSLGALKQVALSPSGPPR